MNGFLVYIGAVLTLVTIVGAIVGIIKTVREMKAAADSREQAAIEAGAKKEREYNALYTQNLIQDQQLVAKDREIDRLNQELQFWKSKHD